MKHTDTGPDQVGLFMLDATDTRKALAAAVTARRTQIDAAALEKALTTHVRFVPTKWPKLDTTLRFDDPTQPRYRAPKPGDGTLKFDARTQRAVDACAEAGAEFWAFHPVNRRCWAVKDSQYVEVRF